MFFLAEIENFTFLQYFNFIIPEDNATSVQKKLSVCVSMQSVCNPREHLTFKVLKQFQDTETDWTVGEIITVNFPECSLNSGVWDINIQVTGGSCCGKQCFFLRKNVDFPSSCKNKKFCKKKK